MKKYMYLTLALVLTASMLVGCGCTNQNAMEDTSAPTVLPTNEEIWNSTEAPTHATRESTMPETSESSETIDRGNGPLEDTTTATTNTSESTEGAGTAEGRSRSMIPGMR